MKKVNENPSQNGVSKNIAVVKTSTAAAKKATAPSKTTSKSMPLTLESRKERLDQLYTLSQKHDKVKETKAKLQKLINNNDPVDGQLTLLIKEGSTTNYVSDYDFQTSNQAILKECLEFLHQKVDLMLEDLDTQILEASI